MAADMRGYVPFYTNMQVPNPSGGTFDATMKIFKYDDGAIYWELRRFYYPVKAVAQNFLEDASEQSFSDGIKLGNCTPPRQVPAR